MAMVIFVTIMGILLFCGWSADQYFNCEEKSWHADFVKRWKKMQKEDKIYKSFYQDSDDS